MYSRNLEKIIRIHQTKVARKRLVKFRWCTRSHFVQNCKMKITNLNLISLRDELFPKEISFGVSRPARPPRLFSASLRSSVSPVQASCPPARSPVRSDGGGGVRTEEINGKLPSIYFENFSCDFNSIQLCNGDGELQQGGGAGNIMRASRRNCPGR